MKSIKFITILFLVVLSSCKSVDNGKNKTTNNQIIGQKNSTENLVWQQVGPSVPNKDLLDKYSDATSTYWHGEGRISAIWIDPKNDDHLLVGVSFGGLFETFDAGKNWKSLTDKVPVNEILKIIVKNDIIYISSGYRFKNPLRFSTVKNEFYGLGVIKSTDHGKNWQISKATFNGDDFSIGINHNTMYVISYSKVFKSTNNANSFTEVADFTYKGLTNTNSKIKLFSVTVHPKNPNIVYVSGRKASAKNAKLFYKSVDGGKTWTNEMHVLNSFIKKDLPKNSSGYYIKDVSLFLNRNTKKLWVHYSVAYEFKNRNKKNKSIKIHSYILTTKDFNKFRYNMHQEIKRGTHFSPKLYEKDDVLYLKAWHLHIKKPKETAFVDVGYRKVHQDCRAVGVDSKGVIYHGNDAGLVKSLDAGLTWSNAFYHLNASLIKQMGYYSNKNTRRIATGTQDAGYYLNDLNGKPYYPIGTYEGGIYISKYNKDRIYIKDKSVKVSVDGGIKFKTIKLNNGKPLKIMHSDGMLVEDPVDSTILYAGHLNEVYVSNNFGEKGSWTNITPKNGNLGRSADLAIPKSNTNILYLANDMYYFPVKNGGINTYKSQGHLMKSIDKGKTWVKISTEFEDLLKNSVISDVEVDDDDPNSVWFTLRNLTKGIKVFHSKNGGKTWQNISYNLPNVPVSRIEYNQKSKLLILANDYGVYYFTGNNWKDYGKGLPKVIITSLVIDYNFNELIVSTFGRGVWQIMLK